MICPSGGFVELAREIVLRARPVRTKNSCTRRRWIPGIKPVGQITAVPPPSLRVGTGGRHRPALDESLRLDVGSMTPFLSDFLPRSSCDEAIHLSCCLTKAGLLRCARNDGGLRIRHQSASRAHPTPSLCNTQRGQTYPSYALYRNIAKFIG